MSNRPESYFYTKSHEWISNEGASVVVGITDYAQTELGDVVYADLPKVGAKITKGSSMFTVESVKAVSDIYAPVDGEITAVNEELKNSPELINQDPFKAGWMVKVTPTEEVTASSPDLLTVAAYDSLIAEVSK